jgi:hypothetical protein
MREVRESARVINLSWFPLYLLHGNCLRHFGFYVNYENCRVRLRIGREKLEEKTYKLSKMHTMTFIMPLLISTESCVITEVRSRTDRRLQGWKMREAEGLQG